MFWAPALVPAPNRMNADAAITINRCSMARFLADAPRTLNSGAPQSIRLNARQPAADDRCAFEFFAAREAVLAEILVAKDEKLGAAKIDTRARQRTPHVFLMGTRTVVKKFHPPSPRTFPTISAEFSARVSLAMSASWGCSCHPGRRPGFFVTGMDGRKDRHPAPTTSNGSIGAMT